MDNEGQSCDGNGHHEKAHGLQVEALGCLPEKTLLDGKQLAKLLGVSRRTLRRMVSRFELPPPVAFAGRSVWMSGRVLGHIEAAAQRAAKEAERQAKKISGLFL